MIRTTLSSLKNQKMHKQICLLYPNNKFFSSLDTGIMSKAVNSRGGVFKMIFLLGSMHAISTYLSSLFVNKPLTIAITDFILNKKIKDQSSFQIFGIIQIGSITLTRGSNDVRFKMTDYKNSIDVLYNGLNKFEFKEGSTVVLTAYCPDPMDKSRIIAIDYMTKHSMEVQNWEDKINSSRLTYGLNVPNDKKLQFN